MLEDVKAGADRAAAFINCEIDGDVSSSAAGGSGGTQIWLDARHSVSMTSNMLIQELHSYMEHMSQIIKDAMVL